jgi:hypothetical protein
MFHAVIQLEHTKHGGRNYGEVHECGDEDAVTDGNCARGRWSRPCCLGGAGLTFLEDYEQIRECAPCQILSNTREADTPSVVGNRSQQRSIGPGPEGLNDGRDVSVLNIEMGHHSETTPARNSDFPGFQKGAERIGSVDVDIEPDHIRLDRVDGHTGDLAERIPEPSCSTMVVG